MIPAITPEILRDVDATVYYAHVPSWLADDARQEACVRILQAARRFDASQAKFRTWCWIQERGAVLDFLRRESSVYSRQARGSDRDESEVASTMPLESVAQFLPASEPSPEREASTREFVDALLRVLNPQERRILVAHFWYGYSWDEIARSMGISRSWAFRVAQRALERLRNYATRQPS